MLLCRIIVRYVSLQNATSGDDHIVMRALCVLKSRAQCMMMMNEEENTTEYDLRIETQSIFDSVHLVGARA